GGTEGGSSPPNITDADKTSPTAATEAPPVLRSSASAASQMRIEVLGDESLRKLKPTGPLDVSHCYRIAGDQQLRTLAEIKQLVTRRLTEKPPLKEIEIVLYKDSPARKVKRASDLETWLDELVAAQKKPVFTYLVNDKVPTDAPLR